MSLSIIILHYYVYFLLNIGIYTYIAKRQRTFAFLDVKYLGNYCLFVKFLERKEWDLLISNIISNILKFTFSCEDSITNASKGQTTN